MPKSLRGYLDELRRVSPEDVLHVEKMVRPHNFDVTAILEHLTLKQRFPAAMFLKTENLMGEESRFPIVSNLFATRERCARALDFSPEQAKMDLSLEYARLEREKVAPVTIEAREAPVKQEVLTGSDADIRILPIVRHYEMDVAPVLTMALVMKDPDEGFYDISFIKTFYKDDPHHTGVSIHTPHLMRIARKYEERGQAAPIVAILGHHPAFYFGALALSPWGSDDYHTVGSFLHEPVRLVPSETWGKDFLVPADAEILIEGEVLPGAKEVVDPFGEVTRHYQAQCIRQAMEVKAITFRRNAIMQDIFSGHQEHWNLGCIPKEGSMFNSLQRKHGGIKAICLPHSGCSRLACYISIKKEREGIAKRIAMSALDEAYFFNWVVMVDEDIDVFNEQDVLWSVFTNVDPTRDVDVIRNAYNLFTTAMQYQKVIIDATRPLDVPFPQQIKVPDAAMKRIRLEDFMEGI
ncbi:MAG: UbiD family decarboxylase [Chloroflexota bacterium]|nr:UbiD family decarboxylase [Chloroflexota bacterium]